MDITFYHILLISVVFVGINISTFLILYLTLGNRGRPKPFTILKHTVKTYWMLHAKFSRRIYWLDELERKENLQYTDWNQGLGYGYMEEPLKLGDQILVRLPKDKFYRLVVAWIRQPDPNNARYFLFRTFYLGTESNAREQESKLKGFQCHL